MIEIVALADGCELTLTHELSSPGRIMRSGARRVKMIDALDQLLSQRAPAQHEPLLVTRQIVINVPAGALCRKS